MAIFSKNKPENVNLAPDEANNAAEIVVPRTGTEVVVERDGGSYTEAGWIVNGTHANKDGILVTEVVKGDLTKMIATEKLIRLQLEAKEGLERQRDAHLGRKVVDIVEADSDIADYYIPITVIDPYGEQPPRKI